MLSSRPGIQPLTKRETDELAEEKLLQLGPLWDRLSDEYLAPAIRRGINILIRKGRIPAPPDELREYEIEYQSPLATAMRSVGLLAVDNYMNMAITLASVNPEALDKVDWDAALDYRAEILNVPVRLLRTEEQVAAIREQRAQMQMQQSQSEQVVQASQATKNFSDAQARVSQSNTLERAIAGV